MSLQSELENVRIPLFVMKKGQRGKGRQVTPSMNFYDFVAYMKERQTKDTEYTVLQFKALPDDQQSERKDTGAYLPGRMKDGLRRNEALIDRSAITFDLDELTPEQFDYLKSGKSRIWDHPFIMHPTRKHSRQFPRVRLIVFLKEAIDAEEYIAVSRHLACHILETRAESLDACDEVSYRPAQIAYFPSVCSDQKSFFIVNDDETGAVELFDAVTFLDEECGDWHDIATLPFSEKRVRSIVARAKRSENPLTKKGIVGAYNKYADRMGGMEWVFEKEIPGVYIKGDPHSSKPRYTYKAGTSMNGMIIEDGGLFGYSNHSTDPLYGQNSNSWDTVRTHKFGDLDVNADGEPLVGIPTAKLPSHAAMDEYAREIPQVMAELFKADFDFEAVDEDDASGEPDRGRKPKVSREVRELVGDDGDDEDWMVDLDVFKDGSVKQIFANQVLIMGYDPRFRKTFQWDEMADETRVMRNVVSKKKLYPEIRVRDPRDGEPLKDIHGSVVKAILTAPTGKGRLGYGFPAPPEGDIWRAIDAAANLYPFHPLKRRVEAVEWDGQEHIDTFFIRHLRLKDTPYHRELSRLFFLAGIGRIYTPGAKFDLVYVIEGGQGGGKSTFLRYLAMDDKFFAELNVDLGEQQKIMEHTKGKFVLEIAELSSLKKSEIEIVKAFISAQEDQSRLAYDRKVSRIKRGFLLTATTNERVYLKDPTGARRFVSMWTPTTQFDPMNFDACKAEVMQAWAEARVAFVRLQKKLGLAEHECPPMMLSKEAARTSAEESKSRQMVDPVDLVAEEIGEWLDKPLLRSSLDEHGFLAEGESDDLLLRCAVTVNSVLRDCYGLRAGTMNGLNVRANDIQEALRRLGWESTSAWPTSRRIVEIDPKTGKSVRRNLWVRKGATTEERHGGFRVLEPEMPEKRQPRHRRKEIEDLI